jgi:hypothetical protein
MNQFQLENRMVKKLGIYYLAHFNYLNQINYSDLTQYKIYWGLKDVK